MSAYGTKRTWPGLCLFVRFRREADMHDKRLKGTVKICYRSKTGFAGNEGDVGTLSLKNGISEHAVTASTLLREHAVTASTVLRAPTCYARARCTLAPFTL
jgi:hypothetical protein